MPLRFKTQSFALVPSLALLAFFEVTQLAGPLLRPIITYLTWIVNFRPPPSADYWLLHPQQLDVPGEQQRKVLFADRSHLEFFHQLFLISSGRGKQQIGQSPRMLPSGSLNNTSFHWQSWFYCRVNIRLLYLFPKNSHFTFQALASPVTTHIIAAESITSLCSLLHPGDYLPPPHSSQIHHQVNKINLFFRLPLSADSWFHLQQLGETGEQQQGALC